jgi:hypothetical protein
MHHKSCYNIQMCCAVLASDLNRDSIPKQQIRLTKPKTASQNPMWKASTVEGIKWYLLQYNWVISRSVCQLTVSHTQSTLWPPRSTIMQKEQWSLFYIELQENWMMELLTSLSTVQTRLILQFSTGQSLLTKGSLDNGIPISTCVSPCLAWIFLCSNIPCLTMELETITVSKFCCSPCRLEQEWKTWSFCIFVLVDSKLSHIWSL